MTPLARFPAAVLGLDINIWGVMAAAALVGGVLFAAQRAGKKTKGAFVLFAFAAAAGVFSGTLLGTVLSGGTPGFSSLGAIAGSFAAGAYLARKKGIETKVLAGAVSLPLIAADAVVRLGCALVFDHPGIANGGPFAAAHGGQGRLNVGLIYFALSLAGALFFCAYERVKKRQTALLAAASWYAASRLLADFLLMPASEGGPFRFLGLTPVQLAAAVFLGSVYLWRFRSVERKPSS